jgi:hypothetical protein
MMKARIAALSSAGLMLIAGCSGGGHAGGSSLPQPFGSSNAIALANAARVTLSINVPPRQTQSFRRGQKFVPASVARKPSYVSPSTFFVALNVYAGGNSIYSTYFPLTQCASAYGAYQCATNLPYGSVTVYTNLYDQYGYLLSTNLYSHPAATTIYPNGSAYSNDIYVTTAGVLYSLQTLSPTDCFTTGSQQSIPLYVLDADGNTIVGPLANPITPTFTAVNGGGLGAINIYAMYNGSPIAINNQTIYDTSLYSSPYFFVSGSEGAITIGATIQNIPVYSNDVFTYTPTAGYAATGTYMAWGLQNAPIYGLYAIAIEQSLNQTVICGNGGVNGAFQSWTYVGSIQDPGNGNPYLVLSDNNNNVVIYDAYVTSDYTRAYDYFQSTFNMYGGQLGPHANLHQTANFVTNGPFVDFFTSANVTGRLDVVSQPVTNGVIQIIDTTNGSITSSSPYNATPGITFSGSTRLSGSPTAHALYYTVPGNPWLYGIDTTTSPGTALTAIDFSATAPNKITKEVYATAPSGTGTPATIVVRGNDTLGNYWVCAFDATNFIGGITCHSTGSTNSNPASMQYDPGTGDLMWASGGTSAFAFPIHGVAPSTFINTTFPGTPSIYTLAHSANRLLPGLEGVPGVAGFYGYQSSGPCSGQGEITWLRWNGSSWVYLANMCWPNHYITLTQP